MTIKGVVLPDVRHGGQSDTYPGSMFKNTNVPDDVPVPEDSVTFLDNETTLSIPWEGGANGYGVHSVTMAAINNCSYENVILIVQ